MAEMDASGGGAILAGKEEEIDSGGRPFPLSMVVGQDMIKQSLLFAAVNPKVRSEATRRSLASIHTASARSPTFLRWAAL